MLVIPSASEGTRQWSYDPHRQVVDLSSLVRCLTSSRLGTTRASLSRAKSKLKFVSCCEPLPRRDSPRDHRFGLAARFRHDFVGLSNPDHFFDCRSPLGYPTPPVVPQRLHAFSNGALLELTAIFFPHDHFSQRLRHHTDFVNRHPTLIASMPALIATFAAHELRSKLSHRKSNLVEIFRRVLNFLDAFRTDRANESLRNKSFHHRSEQERLHIHVKQAGDTSDRVIRMQCAEDKVAGHGGAYRNVRRLHV